jgi:hypothetical protein
MTLLKTLLWDLVLESSYFSSTNFHLLGTKSLDSLTDYITGVASPAFMASAWRWETTGEWERNKRSASLFGRRLEHRRYQESWLFLQHFSR